MDERPCPDRLLAAAGTALTGSLNQRRILRTVVELVVAEVADAAVAVGPGDGQQVDCARLAHGGRAATFQAYRTDLDAVPGLAQVCGGLDPPFGQSVPAATTPAWLWPPEFRPAGELVLVAMPLAVGVGAALILARGPGRPPFRDEERAMLRTFGVQAGQALTAAALYREQGEAMAVLKAELLPLPLPEIQGVEVAGAVRPAEEGLRIGGDFFDVFPPAGDPARSVVVLGDVTGKGAPAAVLTGKVRQSLRALQLVEQRPTELLRVLNDALLQSGDGDGHRFVTMVVGAMRPSGHNSAPLELTLATGGHPPPLVLRSDGTVTEVAVAGALIGVTKNLRMRPATVELAPGEMCLLYSDGLTEARGGPAERQQYGDRRLRQALGSCRGMPAGATVDRLQQLSSEWVGEGEHDDVALLVIRALPVGAPA
ncbi:serine/threonine-protein phosphatase [Natronosporangium hydrolyticum]|uniref:Serine/threonine-protein phosphatase n=1 Tax=Natronosporangium hydrolyticum TaxID=2811111 RepID=A0A895YFD7_9ACTN|nr:PP2C family protein-serine/threonine phosphatase [Natronosporangium hydrolyticum]QSB16527.1 serine/threonine-protein phosphatase [Natronosporangium hydrolyticum]